jgi:pyridinium-3,5-bisthiocarboxylic acid mononucleotide nickel chelatase
VPELIGSLAQKLMAAGALDVFTTAVQMKKQRPGTLLTVLCHSPQRDALMDLVFTESTTFGIREYATRRTVLQRRRIEVETPYGRIGVKIGAWKGRDVTRAPEHADCARCAGQHAVPIRAVYEAALRAIQPARS